MHTPDDLLEEDVEVVDLSTNTTSVPTRGGGRQLRTFWDDDDDEDDDEEDVEDEFDSNSKQSSVIIKVQKQQQKPSSLSPAAKSIVKSPTSSPTVAGGTSLPMFSASGDDEEVQRLSGNIWQTGDSSKAAKASSLKPPRVTKVLFQDSFDDDDHEHQNIQTTAGKSSSFSNLKGFGTGAGGGGGGGGEECFSPARRRTVMLPRSIKAPRRIREEEPMELWRFWGAIAAQVLLPFAIIYCVVKGYPLRPIFLPTGSFAFLSPLMWLLFIGAIGSLGTIMRDPAWNSSIHAHDESREALYSVGDIVAAISLYFTVVVVGAVSTSHVPQSAAARRKRQSLSSFASPEDEAEALHEASTMGLPRTIDNKSNPLHRRRRKMRESRDRSPSKAGSEADEGAERRRSSAAGRGAGGVGRLHVPYNEILFDEVPPLPLDDVSFVYAASDWFQPNRQNEARHLIPSNARQKREKVADVARHRFKFRSGQIVVRNSRRPIPVRDFGGELGLVEEGEPVAIVSRVWSANMRPLYMVDGAQDGAWYELEDDFCESGGGDQTRASTTTTATTATNENDNDEQRQQDKNTLGVVGIGGLQQLGGRLEKGQQHPSTVSLNSATAAKSMNVVLDHDRIVSSEVLLLALSKRIVLMRTEVGTGNGNYCGSTSDAKMPKSVLLVLSFVSGVYCLIPIMMRLFRDMRPQGRGSTAEVVGLCSATFMSFFCIITIGEFLFCVAKSAANYRDVSSAFTRVTLVAERNLWYPSLNLLEAINVQSWFFLRDHITSCFAIAFVSRITATFVVAMAALGMAMQSFVFAATEDTPYKARFDGWMVQTTLFSIAVCGPCFKIFLDAAKTNATFASHLHNIYQAMVAVHEETSATMRHLQHHDSSTTDGGDGDSSEFASRRLAKLHDVKAILDDAAFVLSRQGFPISPFGVPLKEMFAVLVFLPTAVMGAVACVLFVVSGAMSGERWELPQTVG